MNNKNTLDVEKLYKVLEHILSAKYGYNVKITITKKNVEAREKNE